MANYVLGVLWFLPIAFMFYCQHHVCEEYFIPAIKVLVDKAKNSPNKWLQRWGDSAVAGATIMALGCNGPELFCNLISLYIASDAGIGVVVGSEIFNLLVIIGCAILFSKNLPLLLEVPSFVRDCCFYFLSIVLLVWALMINSPNQIDPFEAVVLLIAEVAFVVCVYFTEDIVSKFLGKKEAAVEVEDADAHFHGIPVYITLDAHSRAPPVTMGSMDEDKIQRASSTKAVKDKKRASVMVKGNKESLLGLSEDVPLKYEHLSEVRVGSEGTMYMDFEPNAFEKLTVKVQCKSGVDRERLEQEIKENALSHNPNAWVHNYDASFKGAIAHAKHHLAHAPNLTYKLTTIVELVADALLKTTLAPVDVKDTKKEGRWPLCFLGAMMWLAIFSFLMLEVATQINMCIPELSMAFLGVTLCAVGTSFPNAIASILMAQNGLPDAAIANALGSNVQNVFLAMAFPWIIYMATPTAVCEAICAKPVPQWTPVPQVPPEHGQSVTEGVIWMLGTLVLVILLAVFPSKDKCTFTKPFGYLLVFVYLIYLVWTSYEAFAM
jgi:Ca2+/Na+ antiporter